MAPGPRAPSDRRRARCRAGARSRASGSSRGPASPSRCVRRAISCEYVYEALRAGASGFLLKDVPPEDLIAAVRIVAAGDALIAPAITKRLIEQFARTAPASRPPEQLAELTPRELEVLVLIAGGRSNAEIADELVVSEATVKTHVKRVLAKLRVRDRVGAVVFAYEAGLVTPGSGGQP